MLTFRWKCPGAILLAVAALAGCTASATNRAGLPLPDGARSPVLRPLATCPSVSQIGSDEKVNSTTSTVQFSVLPTTGTQLILLAATGSNATFAAPANYTLLKSSAGYRSAALFVSGSSPIANPKFVSSSGVASGIGVAFGATSGTVDASSLNVAGPSNTGSSAAISPAHPGDAFAMLAMNDATTSNITSAPSGFTEASVAGGVTGQTFSQRDYYLLNPPLSSSAPVLQWDYAATGNTTITAYAALAAAACATPTPSPTPTPVPAPVALVQSAFSAPTTKAASATASLGNVPAQGDLLTACAMTEDNLAVPTPAGWTLLQSLTGKGGGIMFYQFYKIAGSAEPRSLTVTPTAASWQSVSLREYRGENQSSPFAAAASGSTSSNALAVSATPTAAGTLPISCFGANSAMGDTAFTAGAAENYVAYPSSANGNGFVPAYNAAEGQTGPVQTGIAPYTASVTWNLSAGNGPYTYGFLAFVAPAAAATPTPAPTPTATPTPGGTCCASGVEWPNGFEPFFASSIWNHRLTNPDTPRVYAQSGAIMANIALTGQDPTPIDFHTDEYGNGDSSNHPVVFASNSTTTDASVNVVCDLYCNGWGANGVGIPSPIRIPKKARPATGSDHHIAVVQPSGEEMDCWYARQKLASNGAVNNWSPPSPNPYQDWSDNDTLLCGDGQDMGNFYTGPGQSSQSLANAATAGGAAEAAGIVRESELAAGQINHVIFLTSECVASTVYVYPAYQGGDNKCTGSGAQLMFGALIHVKLTDAQINAATTLTRDQKTVLVALHDYGGLVMDSGSHSKAYTDRINVMLESGAAFSPFGVTPPMDTYAAAQGWPQRVIQINEYYQPDRSGFNWSSVLEVLDPCNVQGTC